MPINKFNVTGKLVVNSKEAMTLPKSDTAPSSPVSGDLYFNTTTNNIQIYKSGSWIDVASGSTSLVGDSLAQYSVIVGNASGSSVAVNTNSAGDVLIDETNGATIKASAITDAMISSSAAIAESKLSLDYSTSSLNSAIGNKLALAGGTMSGAIAMGSNKITGLTNGTAASQDAATVAQVESLISSIPSADLSAYFKKDGSVSMTGNILPTSTASNLDIGSASYLFKNVHSSILNIYNPNDHSYKGQIFGGGTGEELTISSYGTNSCVKIVPSGSGVVDVSSAKIVNLATPTAATDAATKYYADASGGIQLITLSNSTPQNITSEKVFLIDSTGTQTSSQLILPAASTLAVGQTFSVVNSTATSLATPGGIYLSNGTTQLANAPFGHKTVCTLVVVSPEQWVTSFEMLRTASGYNVNSRKVINLTDPTSAQDAATKNYVDTAASAKANLALSNLASVAINTSLLPATSGSADVGSDAKPFGAVIGDQVRSKDFIIRDNTGADSGYITANATYNNVSINASGTKTLDIGTTGGQIFMATDSATAPQDMSLWTNINSGTALGADINSGSISLNTQSVTGTGSAGNININPGSHPTDDSLRGGVNISGKILQVNTAWGLGMNGGYISNLHAPGGDLDAANKKYVDDADNLKVSKSGDTMSGNLAMGSNKVTGLAAGSANGDAVRFEQAVLTDGSHAITGDQSFSSTAKIVDLLDPVLPQDAATKKYVDDKIAGMSFKQQVESASGDLENVDIASAPATIGGYTVDDAGDRILLKGQTAPAENGIWIWNGLGVAMTRSTDADTWAELAGAIVYVNGGTNVGGKYICVSAEAGTLGTSPVLWTTFSAASAIDGSGTAGYNSYWTATHTLAAEQYVATARGGMATDVSAFSGVVKASGGTFSASSIVNADVSSSAAIAYSKLSLASSIVNADINSSAAIAYSKLNLSSSIVNADVSSSAAIAYSKLASLSTSAPKALVSSSLGFVSESSITATELDYLSGSSQNIQTALDAALLKDGSRALTGALVPDGANTQNIGSPTLPFGDVFAATFNISDGVDAYGSVSAGTGISVISNIGDTEIASTLGKVKLSTVGTATKQDIEIKAQTDAGAMSSGVDSGDIVLSTNSLVSGGGLQGQVKVVAASLDMGSKKIVNLADPTASQDAATLAYVSSAVGTAIGAIDFSAYFKKDGSVAMTGSLVPASATVVNVGASGNSVASVFAQSVKLASSQTGSQALSLTPTALSAAASFTVSTDAGATTGDVTVKSGVANVNTNSGKVVVESGAVSGTGVRGDVELNAEKVIVRSNQGFIISDSASPTSQIVAQSVVATLSSGVSTATDSSVVLVLANSQSATLEYEAIEASTGEVRSGTLKIAAKMDGTCGYNDTYCDTGVIGTGLEFSARYDSGTSSIVIQYLGTSSHAVQLKAFLIAPLKSVF